MTMSLAYIPRWFDAEYEYAGALDKIGSASGINGWILQKDDFARKFRVEIIAAGQVLASGRTGQFRQDVSTALNENLSCGFNIPWASFDSAAVREALRRDAAATFEAFVPEIGMYVPKYSEKGDAHAIKLGDCLGYLRMNAQAEVALAPSAAVLASPAKAAANPSADLSAQMRLITRSRLFDPQHYAARAGDGPAGLSPLEHYLRQGEAAGIAPNPYFDPKWYAHKYSRGTSAAGALAHYIVIGEAEGSKPCPLFEPAWYAKTYAIDRSQGLALTHYLDHRQTNAFNPNRYFDAKFYLGNNDDVAKADFDAFTHWFSYGIFEGRKGSEAFNADYVWRRYLGDNRKLNPFAAFMDVGADFGWRPTPPETETSVHRQVAIYSAPGPLFEDLGPKIALSADAPKVVALYLPQFHAIAENDRWWGTGFTEWRNLARGLPRFEGHVQPRIPRDLGFYSLEGDATLRRQVALARRSGVHGFCFYYYNFNGRRLLERPVETFLAQQDIDFPFCLMWANENWTRRWDGSEREVLIRQDYRQEDLPALIDDIARHMRDPRYLRASDGRPLFFVYRPDIIPDCRNTIQAWRTRFRTAHGLDPLIVMSQSFGAEDPRPLGFDAALEFPPHKPGGHLPSVTPELKMLDADFDGEVRDYAGVVRESLATLAPPYPLIKTAFPSWDNDARRQGHGTVFVHSTPKAFEAWMVKLLAHAKQTKVFGEALVFVNAWNEWCEGAYLEPDTHYGYAYLNALARSLAALQVSPGRLILIGHDAFPAGAQHLLLNLGLLFTCGFGIETRFVLIGDGEMKARYREVAPTFVAAEHAEPWRALRAHLSELKAAGFCRALTNTAAAGGATEILDDLGYAFVSLIHELPTLIRSSTLEPAYREILKRAKTIVYPSRYVQESLERAFGATSRPTLVKPQGLYHWPDARPDARRSARVELGLAASDKIVLNLGYADLRKGVDLFIGLAERVAALDSSVHFVWVGDVHPDLRPWLEMDVRQRQLVNVHILPFANDVGRYLAAADLFLLTSREDPFPSVVLEALAAGLAVAAFEQSGGHVELLSGDSRLGALLPFGATAEGAHRIVELLYPTNGSEPRNASYRREVVARQFDFAAYGSSLIGLVEPGYRTVSVIVPNYNYARYLDERLGSIFAQTFPVYEILVLDDASDDDSLEVAAAVARAAGRVIALDRRAANSGNPFRQWKAGLERARGEFVWIAEADDASEPDFLAELMRALADDPDAGFGFADSRAIGPDGAVMSESYKGYYREHGDNGLDQDGRFEAKDFLRRFLTLRNLVLNASSVVWRTEMLRHVFANLGEEAFSFGCAGDWRIYVEACQLAKAVRYVASPLNRHRRHDLSVTHKIGKRAHYEEIARVQAIALARGGNDARLAGRLTAWQSELRQVCGTCQRQ